MLISKPPKDNLRCANNFIMILSYWDLRIDKYIKKLFRIYSCIPKRIMDWKDKTYMALL